jgi:DNA-repair protein XRCC1
VLCLSGFQNPLRGVIKGEAISLGATVSPAWTPSCTHLVCAVANTPKHQEVVKSGHGYVVSRMWLNDCALQTKRLPEDHYALA